MALLLREDIVKRIGRAGNPADIHDCIQSLVHSGWRENDIKSRSNCCELACLTLLMTSQGILLLYLLHKSQELLLLPVTGLNHWNCQPFRRPSPRVQRCFSHFGPSWSWHFSRFLWSIVCVKGLSTGTQPLDFCALRVPVGSEQIIFFKKILLCFKTLGYMLL